MMKKGVVVLGLVLLPLAAGAQGVPRAPGSALAAGITVQGRAIVRYPVKSLHFVAQVRGAADEQEALAALRSAGIDDVVIGPLGGTVFTGPATTVRGTVRDVSRAKLERIALSAGVFVRAHPGTSIDNVNFSPSAESCMPHEQEARAAAIADARRRADAVAALAGLSIDAVAAVNENGGCPLAAELLLSPGYSQSLDLGTLTASVQMTESVTFAVSPAPGTGRRRLL